MFFRLEHQDTRIGPYNGGGRAADVVFAWYDTFPRDRQISLFPRPEIDFWNENKPEFVKDILGRLAVTENMLFGFSSRVQFDSWFFNREVLCELSKCGVFLFGYDTDNFITARKQAVARREVLMEAPRELLEDFSCAV